MDNWDENAAVESHKMGVLQMSYSGYVKEITVHECQDGGVLYEIVRDEKWGQLTIRTVPAGATAGGHRHPLTNEFWLILEGEATVFLEYPDGTRWMKQVDGDRPEVIELPAGTGHDIKAHTNVMFLFWADRLYDSETHDKEPWEW